MSSAKNLILITLCLFYFSPSQAYYFFTSSIHEAYQRVLPAEVVGLYSALSGNELGQIKQAGQLLDLQAGDEPALRALEEMNAPLHQRVLQARNSIDQKIDQLHPEAKAFVLGVITKARSLRPMSGKQMDSVQTRKTAAEIIKLYAELSDDAKRSLTVLFPEIANGIEGMEFQELASENVKEDGGDEL